MSALPREVYGEDAVTPKERLAFLRAEDIKARFLLHGTTFALSCGEYWTGFHWHAWRNSVATKALLRNVPAALGQFVPHEEYSL